MRCTLAALGGALIFAFALGVATLRAAEIEVVKGDQEGLGLIAVTGAFRPEDGEKFAAVTAPFTRAAAAFASPGGAIIAGLQMGQVIRLKGFATFSPEGAYCASACAIALAGTPRLMQPGSRIGFHAA
jgi:hypothetical protein